MQFKISYPNMAMISFVNLDKLLMSLRIKNQEEVDYKIDFNNAIQQTKLFNFKRS